MYTCTHTYYIIHVHINHYYHYIHVHTDPGSNNSGYYDLLAVLTHQGRSSSSGHYVAWIRKGNGEWALIRIFAIHIVQIIIFCFFLLHRSVV